jgi:branched-chain amino acid transport system substrate-binding protein
MTTTKPSLLTRRAVLQFAAAGAMAAPIVRVPGALAANEYVIGVASAQTGGLAPFDQPALAGFRFGVDEINAKGGIAGTQPIKLILKETRSDTAQTVQAVSELVQEGAKFIITPADGDPTMAAGQVTQPAGIPTMTLAGTAPVLTSVGSFVFGSYPADNQQMLVLGDYALERGFKRVYLLKSPDAAYTLKGPEYFGEVFKRGGGVIAGEGSFTMNQPDFSAEVTRIKALSPSVDLIMTCAWEPDFPAFIKQLRSAGITTQVFGADVCDTPTVRALGPVVEGLVHSSGGFAEPGDKHDAFNRAFKAKTGIDPDTNYYVNGYDMAYMIDNAVRAAKSTDPRLVRDALANLENVPGAMSSYTFKGTERMPLRSVVIARIEKGQKRLVKRVNPDPARMPRA